MKSSYRSQWTKIEYRVWQGTGRIWQFPNLPLKCKKMLYYAFIQSQVMTNAACTLPFLTPDQTLKIQRACNNGIRAIVSLRWQKSDRNPKSITKIRINLGIPSIAELCQRSLSFEAWKRRQELELASNNTKTAYETRNSHLLKVPNEIGSNRWSIWPKVVKSWNNLPLEIKMCSDPKKAKILIKKLYCTSIVQERGQQQPSSLKVTPSL